MTTAEIPKYLTKTEHAKLLKTAQQAVDDLGLVKASAKMKLTSVSVRSFLQGGEAYAKTLLRVARYAKMTEAAKKIAEYIRVTPKKRPRGAPKPEKKVKAAKKVAPKMKKVAAKTKASKKTARATKPAKKKKKAAAKRDRTLRVPVSPLSGVPVGKELDAIEEAMELEGEIPAERHAELEVAE